MENEEHRHTLQMHTQKKEQILRRASQVTFVKKMYIAKILIYFRGCCWMRETVEMLASQM